MVDSDRDVPHLSGEPAAMVAGLAEAELVGSPVKGTRTPGSSWNLGDEAGGSESLMGEAPVPPG